VTTSAPAVAGKMNAADTTSASASCRFMVAPFWQRLDKSPKDPPTDDSLLFAF
jgi:hypothetical protein